MQKTKFILIGLGGVALISFFLFLASLGARQSLQRQNEDLKSENSVLKTSLDKLTGNLRENENKISVLKAELDKANGEKEELQKKYETAQSEKNALAEKLKAGQERQPTLSAAGPAPESGSPTADSYWAGILKAKTELEVQLESIRKELRSAQVTNEQLQREKSILELDMKSLSRDRGDLQHKFEYNQKMVDTLTQELVSEKNERVRIQTDLAAIKKENALLLRQLKSLVSRKAVMDKRLEELEENNFTLERRFGDMEVMLKDKMSQIGDIKNQIEAAPEAVQAQKMPQGAPVTGATTAGAVQLPAIVVRPQETQSTPVDEINKLAGGKVLAINRENNFVVIDLGQAAAVRQGDTFNVYRGDKFIAKIEAMQVRRDIAACDIKKETSPIKVGDQVK